MDNMDWSSYNENIDYTEKYLKYKNKYLALKKSARPQSNLNMKGGASGQSTTRPKIYLFKAEWCPHCRIFKPTWDQLQKKMKSVEFITLDSDANAREIKKFKIEGYPTIILMNGGKAIEYVGPRDEMGVENFINEYI